MPRLVPKGLGQYLNSTIETILAKLDNVKKRQAGGWTARCPSHEDQHNSLAVTEETGKILLHCFRGCSTTQIVAALGLEMSSLFGDPPIPTSSKKTHKEIISQTAWGITDTKGNMIAQHIRYNHDDGSKSFAWFRNGKKGLDGYKVEDLPLYGLYPMATSSRVIITEGEKAADSLIKRGYTALGTVCGASSCPSKDSLLVLKGYERVDLWPDNDPPGKAHMNNIAQRAIEIGICPHIIIWAEAPPQGDAADYLGDIESLLEQAIEWKAKGMGDIKILDDRVEQYAELLDNTTLTLRAENIREERTGIHAKVSILLNNKVLAFDTFNITRDKERTSLAGSAMQHFSDEAKMVYPQVKLKYDLALFCNSLQEYLRKGEPAREIWTFEKVSPPQFLLEPLLIKGHSTIMFGEKAVAKSMLGLIVATCLLLPWDTNPMGWHVPEKSVKTLILDWAVDYEITHWNIKRLQKGMELPDFPIFHRKCIQPLANEVAEIKTCIKDIGAEVIIIDSLGPACGGDTLKSREALAFSVALRDLNVTSLIIGQTSKDKESKEKSTYGSTYFEYMARSVWELRKSEDEDEGEINIAMFQKYFNFGKRYHPIGLKICFEGNDTITIGAQDTRTIAAFLERQGANTRILEKLKSGAMTVNELSKALELPRDTVKQALNRLCKKQKVVKLSAEKEPRWGLPLL